MALDTHYIPMSLWQEYFVDYRTGLPLSGGVITFYKDSSRTTLKNVYQLTGTPTTYAYIDLPNPLILSSQGTIVDALGNDIIPYFKPYDASGKLELYYYTVYASDAAFQFSRQGLPNLTEGTDNNSDLINYLPNGQFLIHNSIPATSTIAEGQITSNITYLDTGNSTLERQVGTTAVDLVTFPSFGGAVTIPTGNPKYACKVNRQSTGTGGFISLRWKFMDVNRFSSDTQDYTFSFVGKTNIGGSEKITINLIKFYGIGGSATDTNSIGDITLTNSYTDYNLHFKFGNNIGKSITSDSYIQLELSFPTYAFDLSFTNFLLCSGVKEINIYPVITESQMRYQSMSMPIPDYDGLNVGLPVIQTLSGFIYDRSHIGRKYDLYIPYNAAIHINMLHADGSSYDTYDKSSIGIPYKRLRDALALDATYAWQPRYGTGKDRCTALFGAGPSNTGDIVINTPASVAPNAVDGAVPTGFIFVNSTTYTGFKSTNITYKAGNLITAGSYFIFYDNSSRVYIVWYKVGGAGTKPATAAYKYIEVDIALADTDNNVRDKTTQVINYQYFAVPDGRGAFSRMIDAGLGRDPGAAARYSSTDYSFYYFGISGDHVGSYQADDLRNHNHSVPAGGFGSGHYSSSYGGGSGIDQGEAQVTGYHGGNETRPINFYIDCAIGF